MRPVPVLRADVAGGASASGEGLARRIVRERIDLETRLVTNREGEEEMRFTQQAVFMTVAAAFVGGSAHAAWTLGNGDTLAFSELFAAGSDRTVYIDDKRFVFDSFTSAHFDVGSITLIGFISLNGNGFGFRNVGFDLTGGFGDTLPGDQTIAEANLQYTVEIVESAYAKGLRLCDVRATFNGNAIGEGAYARVDETIIDLDTNTFLGQLSVFDFWGPPRETQLTDYVNFCPDFKGGYRAFEINKDMKFFAPSANSASSASFVRQEFSQIPAPGALALLGLAGLFGRRLRG